MIRLSYKTITIVLLLLLTLFSSVVHKIWAEERPGIDRPLRIAAYSYLPLYNKKPDGSLEGLFYDLTEAIANKNNWKREYVHGSFPQCLDWLEKGEIDLLPGISYSEKRDEIWDYNQENVMNAWGEMYAHIDIDASTIEDLDNKRIGLMRRDISAQDFVKLSKKLGVETENIYYETLEEQFDSLNTHDVDAITTTELQIESSVDMSLYPNVKKTPIIFAPITLQYAAPEGTGRELFNQIDEYIRESRDDPSSKYNSIISRWLGGYSPHNTSEKLTKAETLLASKIQLSEREGAWLDKNISVRVGVSEYPPFVSIRKGEPAGIVIDLLNRISEMSGVSFEYIEGHSFKTRLDGLINRSGPVDLLTTVQKTPDREKNILFTDAYLVNRWMIFTRDNEGFISSIEDLSDKTVATVKGYLVTSWLERTYPDVKLLIVENQTEGLQAVSSGKATAFIGSLRPSAAIIHQLGFGNLKVAAPSSFPDGETRMGIRKDWPELQSIANKVLAAIPEEEKAAIISKWSPVTFDHGVRPEDAIKWTILALLSGFGMVCLFLLWNRSLKKQVTIRTAELSRAHETLAAKEAEEHALINAVSSSFFLMDTAGTIIVANRGVGNVYGKAPEDLVGENAYTLLQPELAESRRAEIQAAIEKEELHVFVDERLGRSIENRIYPIRDKHGMVDGLAVLGIDITEKLEAQKQIEESEIRFRSTFEQAAVGIAHADPIGRFLRINEKFCDIVGYSREEMLAQTFQDITHPEDLDSDIAQVQRLLGGEVSSYSREKRYIHKDGKTVWVNLTVSLVRDAIGEPDYMVGVIENIDDRKQAELDIFNYQKRLKALAVETTSVEEKERRTIAADLHDNVGQSLAIARMQLQEVERAESHLERNVLVKDVSNLLLQASRQTRNLMVELSSPSLNEIGLSAAIAEWLEEQVEKRYGLKTEFVDNRSHTGQPQLDDNTRALLFRNTREVLTNTVKHASAEKVKVQVAEDDAMVLVIIEDDGIGFDPEAVENDLDKRNRFGLFSVRERLNDLGGWLEISSEQGKGCKVVMAVPMSK